MAVVIEGEKGDGYSELACGQPGMEALFTWTQQYGSHTTWIAIIPWNYGACILEGEVPLKFWLWWVP